MSLEWYNILTTLG